MSEANLPNTRPRPLSPHLSIYKPMLSMMMSIVHRITGVGLYYGMVIVAWWLMSAAAGPNPYGNVQAFANNIFGKLILFGFTWSLMHHLCGGIRHLMWDLGYGFGPTERETLTWATLIGGIGLTLLIWIVGLMVVRS